MARVLTNDVSLFAVEQISETSCFLHRAKGMPSSHTSPAKLSHAQGLLDSHAFMTCEQAALDF